MSEPWIEIARGAERRRHVLAAGLTRFGGPGCEVELEGAGADQIHVWSDPPKALFVGAGAAPRLDGAALDEATLHDGARIEWGEWSLVVGLPPVVEELPPEDPAPRAAGGTGAAGSGGRAADRVVAGLAADLGLADRKVVQRWQQAVIRSEYDADACARELLASANVAPDEPRLVERAGRLQRDLLMMPFQRGMRGAARRARGASRRGMAYLVANLIAISVYTLVLVAIMLLVRVNYDFSFDGAIDRVLELVTPADGGGGE